MTNNDLKDLKEYFAPDFYESIHHEMKTPLCVILSALKLMENKTGNDCLLSEKLRIIRQNCYRLLRMLSNSIEMAKLQSEKNGLNPVSCNIADLTKEIVQSVLPYAEENNCSIEFFSPETKLYADIDIDKYEKIILNIISNAIKYSKPCIIKVSLSVSTEENTISICISDSGKGIPYDMQQKIFEKFSRGAASHLSRGDGIGLWLVNSLVKLHNGKMKLESNPENGTAVTVTLPASQPEKFKNKSIKETDKDYIKDRVIESVKIELSDIYSSTLNISIKSSEALTFKGDVSSS